MSDFLTQTKELLEKATKGPWDNQHGTIRVAINEDLCCPLFESRTPAELGKGRSYDARFADAWKQEHANAALIVHLVNNAPLFLELAECLQHIEEYWNGSRTDGAMEDALEEIQYSARTILSKLNGAAS